MQTPARADGANHSPIPVEIRHVHDSFELLRAGKPFFIQGAGGDASKEVLVECGGNSFRTWGAEQLDEKLDAAHRLGLAVAVGIWLAHPEHGFDYHDPARVAAQYEEARRIIAKYKDHPAVLMWGIGNEMEGQRDGDDPAVWKAVNQIALSAKELDKNHPTMTVIAEIGGKRIPCINDLCPDIDIVGINSYGGGHTLAKRYRERGGRKPFVVTEFGPLGFWEVPKTAWGAPIEQISSDKARVYRQTYEQSILNERRKLCLGSYAFIWGHKQEATATWFGMFFRDGTRTEAADVMMELWSGKKPPNVCPKIQSLRVDGRDEVHPGAVVTAHLDASDPDDHVLKVTWELHTDPLKYPVGGAAEKSPRTFPEAVARSDENSADIRMPDEIGAYRLFVFVRDSHGGGAVANVPLNVRAP